MASPGREGRQVKLFLKREKMDEVALISPNKMAVPGPLPDGRRSGGDEGLGSRLHGSRHRTGDCCHATPWRQQPRPAQARST